jgi:hypothetical protein
MGSLSAFTISGATYTYQIAINCSLMNNATPFVVNGANGFTLNGSKQVVWTQCADNLSLYYNNFTSYVIANNTTTVPFDVEYGNASGNSSTLVWGTARAIYENASRTDAMGLYNLGNYTGTKVTALIGEGANFTTAQGGNLTSNLGVGWNSTTMSFWMQAYSIGNNNRGFLDLRSGTNKYVYMLGQNQYTVPSYKLFGLCSLNGLADYYANTSYAIPNAVWEKYTFVYNYTSGNLSVYANTTLIGSINATSNNGTAADYDMFCINQRCGQGWTGMSGANAAYDQIEIYPEAKNTSWLAERYNNEVGKAGYGLLAYNETTNTLTVLCGVGGASCTGNDTAIPPANRTISATAAGGYVFNNWTATDANCTIKSNTSASTNVSMVSGNCKVTAGFLVNPNSCKNLTTAGETLTLTGAITSAGNTYCMNVSAQNVTINCNGFVITGDNTTGREGIYSNQYNTTIKNCNVSNFSYGIIFDGATYGTINNTTSSTTLWVTDTFETKFGLGANYPAAIILANSSFNSLNNINVPHSHSAGVEIGIYASWNNLTNIVANSDTDTAINFACNSAFNRATNLTLTCSPSSPTQTWGLNFNGANNNTVTNFTSEGCQVPIDLESSCSGVYGNSISGGSRIIGTPTPSYALVTMIYNAGNVYDNVLFNNNFTGNIGQPYISDTSGRVNYWNSSTEGNIWGDVVNGSVNITGNVSSSIAGYYIGFNGTGYPYSSAKSSRIPASVTDYHPLTPFLYNDTFANLTVLCGTGGASCLGNATQISTSAGATSPISATAAANYMFSSWTVSSGDCTIASATSASTTATLITTNCTVTASFTLSYKAPPCLTSYSVLNINFTYTVQNQTLCAPWYQTLNVTITDAPIYQSYSSSTLPGGVSNTSGVIIAFPRFTGTYALSTSLNYSATADEIGSAIAGSAAISLQANITTPITNNTSTLAVSTCTGAECYISNSTVVAVASANYNASQTITISRSVSATATPAGSISSAQATLVPGLVTSPDYSTIGITNEFATSDISYIVPQQYISFNNGKVLRTDGLANQIVSSANSSSMCRLLLYFNNPYYGNVQLIPKITYIPSTAAYPDFYNASDNSAFIPNNTITYIYDSVTSAWYIVPASTCNSYSIVSSISTLQYNPTGITGGSTGTIPISVSSISGSCSFASPVVTCTGTDTSNTLISLTLAAMGNSTAACNNSVAGSSGTLTCTLPATNGTYSAYFYGTDASGLNYLIVGNSYTIGNSTTNFGRDGYLMALIVVVVAATLMTSSIAVSMVLACFGLFICVAFGIVPIGTAAIAALFAVVAFAVAYRLKV